MKFLVADPEKRNPYILQRIKDEGNEVLLLTQSKHRDYNLCESVFTPQEALEWNPDVALFIPGLGQAAHHFYSRGIKVLGGGLIHDTFYEDPEYVTVLASRVRVPICRLDNGGPKIKAAGLYSKTGFIGPALAYSQEFGLHSNSGNAEAIFLRQLPSDSILVRETFSKLEKALTCVDFCGWVFLEIQLDPDTGVPHIHSLSVEIPEGFYAAFLEGLDQPLSKLLESVANRKKGFTFQFKEELVGAVKVTIPPYPLTKFPWLEGAEQLVAEQLVLRGAKGLEIPSSGHHWVDVTQGDGLKTSGPEICWVSHTSPDWEKLIAGMREKANGVLPTGQFKQNLGLNYLRKELTYFEETLEKPKAKK